MIRFMEQSDVSRVEEIERLCFTEPWTAELLRQGLDCNLDTYLVLEESEGVSAYCAMRIIGDEAEVQRLAVVPERRGLGLAKELMDTMTAFARKRGVSAMTLEVRSQNAAARSLYRSCGFCEEAVRIGYYRKPPDAAVIMWKRGI